MKLKKSNSCPEIVNKNRLMPISKHSNSRFQTVKLIKIMPVSKRSNSRFQTVKLIKIMPVSKRSQTAIEFLVVVGFMFFIFTIFLASVQISTSDKIKEEQTLKIKGVVTDVQSEINLAFESREGYYREFTIPKNINGLNYNIQIIENLVYLNTTDGKNAIALPVQEVTGDINIPNNFIKKENGIIKLNIE